MVLSRKKGADHATALRYLAATALVGLVGGWISCGSAAAQDPFRRPSVSPYLNLLIPDQFGIPGGNPGQYQTLVEPFIEGRQAAMANRAGINRLQNQVNNGGARGGGGSAGFHARYMNYSHYYSGIRH